MEALKILEKHEKLNWDFDEEADVLYISTGTPQAALGIDVGQGIIVRYKEDTKEIVGLDIIGFKEKCMEAMAAKND